MSRSAAAFGALLALVVLAGLAVTAPEHLGDANRELAYAGPGLVGPFGGDQLGRPLLQYAQQGAEVVLGPAIAGALLVAVISTAGGLLRCVGDRRVEAVMQGVGEVLGALPRMVVLLVAALLIPSSARGLLPLALVWALLASPGAVDEAAAVAERLGGARFVEALRAHGFSRSRVFLYHIVFLNLRPVVVRQASEVLLQVTFLELGLSYLAVQDSQSSFTHSDSLKSWADLLYMGYTSIGLGMPTAHALWLGLGLVAIVTTMTRLTTSMVRAR
jgi:ABC-type dipeptide/oligopeptide/nickel transport system permease subunit